MKKNIIIFLILILLSIIGIAYFLKIEIPLKQQKDTAVAQCLELNKKEKLSKNVKDCFDNLSNDEFLSLFENEEASKLNEEVQNLYDTRTEGEKKIDEQETAEFFNNIKLENN